MTDKASCWSITLNNPTQEEIDNWKNIKVHHWVKEAVGQLEKGAEGTPHIQGMLKTEYIRFAQVKKALPRAHIEAAKNQAALTKYVQKEDTRVAVLQQQTKLADNKKVQETLTTIVEQTLTYKQYGSPDMWIINKPQLDNRSRLTFTREFIPKIDHNPLDYVAEQNEQWIQKNADSLIDDAVNRLIREGYYGIETVICNNQVRSGIKKYLTSIIIRHVKFQVQASTPSPQSNNPEDQETHHQEVD